jgi:RecG-like helicase
VWDDLFYFFPIRWLDRGMVRSIRRSNRAEESCIVAFPRFLSFHVLQHARKKGFEVVRTDGTGYLSLKWFQWSRGYLQEGLPEGDHPFSPPVKAGAFGGILQIVHPEVTVIGEDETPGAARRIIPLYSQNGRGEAGIHPQHCFRSSETSLVRLAGRHPAAEMEERFG